MSDTDTTSSADAGSTSYEPQALTLDAAASRLVNIEREEAEAETPEQRDPAPSEPEDASQPADANEDDGNEDQGEDAAEDAGDGKGTNVEDLESVELDRLHGNTKVRLRDGTEWTVGEIKRRLDDVRQVDQARQDFEAKASEFQQVQAHFAQRAQFIEQIAPQAIAAIEAQLPAIPEEPQYDPSDPFAYIEQKAQYDRVIADYNAKVGQIQQLQHATQMQAQEREQHHKAALDNFLAEQKVKLFEKNPDLRDPVKLKEFETDLYKYGTETYGFQKQELDNTYDHRLIAVFKDAAAYRKLKEKPVNKPAPAARPSVPVAQPGRRMSGSEAATARSQELRSRVNKPGGLSMSEAASLLSQIES